MRSTGERASSSEGATCAKTGRWEGTGQCGWNPASPWAGVMGCCAGREGRNLQGLGKEFGFISKCGRDPLVGFKQGINAI